MNRREAKEKNIQKRRRSLRSIMIRSFSNKVRSFQKKYSSKRDM